MSNCRNRSNGLMVVSALAMLALQVSAPAQAGLIVTNGPYAFSGSASVTDTKATQGATTNNGAALGANMLIPQFDAALGVLTGVTHQITSTRTITLAGNGAGGAGSGTATGNGASATANLAAPGVSATFGTLSSPNANCSSVAPCSYSSTSVAAPANGSPVVSAGSLNAYVGGGTVSATRIAPTLSVTSGGTKPSTTATATQNWSGTLTTSYSYLLHAAPSFDGTQPSSIFELDFGDMMLGASADPLLFSIFNLADANRVALNLDNVAGSGDTAILTTDISAFMNLTAGQSSDIFSGFMDTSVLGSFNASYLLTFSDEDTGAAASRYTNMMMTLNLRGTVVPVPLKPSMSVPEPGSLALFGAAIFGLVWSRRSRATRMNARPLDLDSDFLPPPVLPLYL